MPHLVSLQRRACSSSLLQLGEVVEIANAERTRDDRLLEFINQWKYPLRELIYAAKSSSFFVTICEAPIAIDEIRSLDRAIIHGMLKVLCPLISERGEWDLAYAT